MTCHHILLWTALASTLVAGASAAAALVAPVEVRLRDNSYLGMRPAPDPTAEIAATAAK